MSQYDRDAATSAVRSWYSRSFPEMGYLTEPRRFGLYSRNIRAHSSRTNRVTVKGISLDEVEEFFADLRRWYDESPVRIWVDDRKTDEAIGSAFVKAGCVCQGAEVFLAHVGDVPVFCDVSGLTIEAVTAENLTDFASTKLKAFGDTESDPSPDLLESEIAIRGTELEGKGRFLIGRLEGEPAGVIVWFDIDSDRFISQVATRVPFRRRGVAKGLLSRVIRDAYERGCRSLVISTDPADTPIHIYRRLGFTDELYWRMGYSFQLGKAQ
ncbi:MAG: GNAT family N-acetyltransferase [Planctomycetes bacterium]|nr:GNAT family N-acetyltransferase [Planctomycetota bacterium]